MRHSLRWGSLLVLTLGLGPGIPAVADEEKATGDGRLRHIESVPRDDLETTVSAENSPDGRFLYAASWNVGTVTGFARDVKTGRLEHRQTITDRENLAGATALVVSPDGRLAIATAFRSRSAVLYARNVETGELTQSDVARDGVKAVQMQWPIDVAFAPDSKFVYVLDDNAGKVVAFRIDDGKLGLVGADEGKDGCYRGGRGIAFHPDGKTLFVASRTAGLVVADRDQTTGTTSVRQVIKDEEGDAHGLEGAMGVAVSRDGRSIYVSAGRFEGDNAVSAFRLESDGRVSFLQEFLNGTGELRDFVGGNSIAITPDGLNVYAVATRSGTVACFRRDPATGKLRYLETLDDGGEGGGENGAAGIGISPDSRYVYVATEDRKSLSIFQRDEGK
jgi:6-phosphogluconolactonase (cycloisomerase 2 family)